MLYATAVTNTTGYKFNVYDVTGTTLVTSIESAFGIRLVFTIDGIYMILIKLGTSDKRN